MKKIVIAGAGHMGLSASRLLDPNRVDFLGFADNDPAKWTLEDGSYPEASEKPPVFSIQTAVDLAPDEFIISAIGKERARAIEEQLKVCRFYGNIMKLHELYEDFDIRSRCLKELAGRIDHVPGAVAELGVYQGDIAWQINALLPDRQFYLFDTFEGFTESDVATEKAYVLSGAAVGEFSDTTVGSVLERLPYPENCHIRKGHFPETAAGLAHAEFAFVSLDADLYEPTKAGIEFFYPRLNDGGIMIIHDYNNTRFKGVNQAVKEYERTLIKSGGAPLKLVPLADLHGSCVIVK
ncbi:MAG: class I SAM-dependent methyltransferase [Firmicutes bacterium]|nr:class I SAM-dependent methyltransferase [Bacillota bacterium]